MLPENWCSPNLVQDLLERLEDLASEARCARGRELINECANHNTASRTPPAVEDDDDEAYYEESDFEYTDDEDVEEEDDEE